MKTETNTNNFDVQSIGIDLKPNFIYDFISKPENLPLWTNAFSNIKENSAVMETPMGKIEIGLETITSETSRTVDWIMTMPDGSIGKAFSRVSENGAHAIYSFVLLAPPVPLEQIEGALSAQKLVLAEELKKLKNLLETS